MSVQFDGIILSYSELQTRNSPFLTWAHISFCAFQSTCSFESKLSCYIICAPHFCTIQCWKRDFEKGVFNSLAPWSRHGPELLSCRKYLGQKPKKLNSFASGCQGPRKREERLSGLQSPQISHFFIFLFLFFLCYAMLAWYLPPLCVCHMLVLYQNG